MRMPRCASACMRPGLRLVRGLLVDLAYISSWNMCQLTTSVNPHRNRLMHSCDGASSIPTSRSFSRSAGSRDPARAPSAGANSRGIRLAGGTASHSDQQHRARPSEPHLHGPTRDQPRARFAPFRAFGADRGDRKKRVGLLEPPLRLRHRSTRWRARSGSAPGGSRGRASAGCVRGGSRRCGR